MSIPSWLLSLLILAGFLSPHPTWGQTRPGDLLQGPNDPGFQADFEKALLTENKDLSDQSCIKKMPPKTFKDMKDLIDSRQLTIGVVDLSEKGKPKLASYHAGTAFCAASIPKIAIIASMAPAYNEKLVDIESLPERGLKDRYIRIADLQRYLYMDEMRAMAVLSRNSNTADVAEKIQGAAWEDAVVGKSQCYINERVRDMGISEDLNPGTAPQSGGDQDPFAKVLYLGKSYRPNCDATKGKELKQLSPRFCHCGGPVWNPGYIFPGGGLGAGTQVASSMGILSFYTALEHDQVKDPQTSDLIRRVMNYPCEIARNKANYNRFVKGVCEPNPAAKPEDKSTPSNIYRKSGSFHVPLGGDRKRHCYGDSALIEHKNGTKYAVTAICNDLRLTANPAKGRPKDIPSRCASDDASSPQMMEYISNRIDCLMKARGSGHKPKSAPSGKASSGTS